jgi:hypothetical protein
MDTDKKDKTQSRRDRKEPQRNFSLLAFLRVLRVSAFFPIRVYPWPSVVENL